MRISAHSRRRFADLCAGHGTVRTIADLFGAEGIEPDEGHDTAGLAQRRSVVAQHEATLDLTSDADNRRLLRVYAEAVAEFGRSWDGSVLDEAKRLVDSLQRDGALVENGRLVVSPPGPAPVQEVDLTDYSLLARPEVLERHLQRINANVERDPPAAIAACKELVESTCKFVLENYGEPYGRKDDLLALYKAAAKALKLSAEAVPDSAKGSRSSQQALRSMAASVQALAELRNELGLGHGHTRASPALGRHAKLCASLTRGLVEFLLDTWHVRRASEGP